MACGGVHSNKDNEIDDGDDDHTMMKVRTSLTTTFVFDSTTNLVVGLIPGRERGVVIATTMTKTTVGRLVA